MGVGGFHNAFWQVMNFVSKMGPKPNNFSISFGPGLEGPLKENK